MQFFLFVALTLYTCYGCTASSTRGWESRNGQPTAQGRDHALAIWLAGQDPSSQQAKADKGVDGVRALLSSLSGGHLHNWTPGHPGGPVCVGDDEPLRGQQVPAAQETVRRGATTAAGPSSAAFAGGAKAPSYADLIDLVVRGGNRVWQLIAQPSLSDFYGIGDEAAASLRAGSTLHRTLRSLPLAAYAVVFFGFFCAFMAVGFVVCFAIAKCARLRHHERVVQILRWATCRSRSATLADLTRPIWKMRPREYNSWAEPRLESWKSHGERIHAHRVVTGLLNGTCGASDVDSLYRQAGTASQWVEDFGVDKLHEPEFFAYMVATEKLKYQPVKSRSRDIAAEALADRLHSRVLVDSDVSDGGGSDTDDEAEPQGFPEAGLNPKAARVSMRAAKGGKGKPKLKVRRQAEADDSDEAFKKAQQKLHQTTDEAFLARYDPSLLLALRGSAASNRDWAGQVTAVVTNVPAPARSEKTDVSLNRAGAKVQKAVDAAPNRSDFTVGPYEKADDETGQLLANKQKRQQRVWFAASRTRKSNEKVLHWKLKWSDPWQRFDPDRDDAIARPWQLFKSAMAKDPRPGQEALYRALHQYAVPSTGAYSGQDLELIEDFLENQTYEDDKKLYVVLADDKVVTKIMPTSLLGPDWGWMARPVGNFEKTMHAAQVVLEQANKEAKQTLPGPQAELEAQAALDGVLLPPLAVLFLDGPLEDVLDRVPWPATPPPSPNSEGETEPQSVFDALRWVRELTLKQQELAELIAEQAKTMAKMSQEINTLRAAQAKSQADLTARLSQELVTKQALVLTEVQTEALRQQQAVAQTAAPASVQAPQQTAPQVVATPAKTGAEVAGKSAAVLTTPAGAEPQSLAILPTQPSYVLRGMNSVKEQICTGFFVKHNNTPYIVTVHHDGYQAPDHWRCAPALVGDRAELGELRLSVGPAATHVVGEHKMLIYPVPRDYHTMVMRKGNSLKIGYLDPTASWTYYGGLNDGNVAIGVTEVQEVEVQGGKMLRGILGGNNHEKTERGWSGSVLAQHRSVNHTEALGVHTMGPAQSSANRMAYVIPFPADLDTLLPKNGSPPAGASTSVQPQSGGTQSPPKRGPSKQGKGVRKAATRTQTSTRLNLTSPEPQPQSGSSAPSVPVTAGANNNTTPSPEQLQQLFAAMSKLLLQQGTGPTDASKASDKQ